MLGPSPLQRRLDAIRDGRAIRPDRTEALGAFLPRQFDALHRRPFERLGEFVEMWAASVPGDILTRSRISAFHRGVLTIHVDGSSTLYAVDRLLKAGLEEQLRRAGRKVVLRRVRLAVDASLSPPVEGPA